ncbi:hypothetical protein AB0J82_36780 [Asanoa sp. NPDC049518]|uniref:hypothetical protein n=1 Tax=unclassified Asanoa TaxID=2685164 RepID=UPI00341574ED
MSGSICKVLDRSQEVSERTGRGLHSVGGEGQSVSDAQDLAAFFSIAGLTEYRDE